jgi:hypothetical protein
MSQYQFLLAGVMLIALTSQISSDSISFPPERYELYKGDACIQYLVETHGLITIFLLPTKAIMHPA